MERIRICDIAEELGVSTATVSNVIHGKTHKVSSETVQRVQELLEKRQYIPSMAGILLAQNDSRIIGIVVNDHKKYESHVLEDPFIAASLNALSSEIDRAGQFMMVKATTKADDIIRFASMWNLDGMVLIGFCEEDYQLLRNHMRIPFVAYDGFFEHPKGICNLTIDNYDGGFQVGQHFKALGHQRALCIADNNICMDKERWEGFHTAFPNADFWQIPMGQSQRRRFYCEHLEALKRYTAFQYGTFIANQALAENPQKGCIADLAPHAKVLRHHGGNKKLMILDLGCRILGYSGLCALIRAVYKRKKN